MCELHVGMFVIYLVLFSIRTGARFSKVPRPFRARKASCQTAIRLFLKADLFTCF